MKQYNEVLTKQGQSRGGENKLSQHIEDHYLALMNLK